MSWSHAQGHGPSAKAKAMHSESHEKDTIKRPISLRLPSHAHCKAGDLELTQQSDLRCSK